MLKKLTVNLNLILTTLPYIFMHFDVAPKQQVFWYLYFKYFFGWVLVLVLKIFLKSILPVTDYSKCMESHFSHCSCVTDCDWCDVNVHQGGHIVYLQYSNWRNNEPSLTESNKCVLVDQNNEWLSFDCNQPQKYVCQS